MQTRPSSRTIVEQLSRDRHRVEFTVSDEVRRKLEYARSLMRHRNPKGDFGFIIEAALDLLIPRLERERFGKTKTPRKPMTPEEEASTTAGVDSDHIPQAVRDAVSARDEY